MAKKPQKALAQTVAPRCLELVANSPLANTISKDPAKRKLSGIFRDKEIIEMLGKLVSQILFLDDNLSVREAMPHLMLLTSAIERAALPVLGLQRGGLPVSLFSSLLL